MDRFAQIAVNVPSVHDQFDYLIPINWRERLKPGHLVEVPFGKQKVQGIVVGLKANSNFSEIKEIGGVLDEEPAVNLKYIEMAEALSELYFQPASAYLTAMLPPGIGQLADTLYEAKLADNADKTSFSPIQQRLINILTQRGKLRGRQIDHAFKHIDWRKSMRPLVRKGFVITQPILPSPKTTKKQINTVRLHPEIDSSSIRNIITGRKGSTASKRRRRVLELLAREGKYVDVSYIYASTGASSNDIRYLEEHTLVAVNVREAVRDPIERFLPEGTTKPQLTKDQLSAWQKIHRAMESSKSVPVIIRGITGSGKTELYLRSVEETGRTGKQSIVLVPEISLTPQTIQRFLDRFPGRVGVIHSRLSPGERYDTWRRARKGEISVLIGARSALFTPLPNPGLIILDECHDDSYYQGEMRPVYHSMEAAIILGKITGAAVIFGSATPNVDLYFRARHERWLMIHLDKRIATQTKEVKEHSELTYLPLPKVDVVDMREELQQGNRSIFSRILQGELRKVIRKKQQAILYLNRRGSTTIIFCRDCGYTIKCPRCDFPLTFHQDSNRLMCHTCGYARHLIKKCTKCGSSRVRQYGMGTERVEKSLLDLIPTARVLRWDADTAAGKQSEAIILSHFRRHNADVLIGTQMLAKGLDLPLVTLVGAILADVGLNFPDYRAGERAFQLLTQVAGRAGRSQLGGRAILQTFQPDHYAIQHAAKHDFMEFFKAELAHRRDLQYPPFSKIIRFETRDHNQKLAEERAMSLTSEISEKIADSEDRTLQLIGPAPPYFHKRSGYYRWQIILKGNRPELIVKLLKLEKWRVDVNPPNLL